MCTMDREEEGGRGEVKDKENVGLEACSTLDKVVIFLHFPSAEIHVFCGTKTSL